MPIQFRQRGCILEYSEDSGLTWFVAADLTSCIETVIAGPPGEQKRCNIAVQLTEHVKRVQNLVISGMNANSSTNTIIAAALPLL